jgi:uncharacterized protein YndB with AHSA1/START domain
MTTPDVPLRFELELTVPGPAEQVWQAIATAEGISAWMMPAEFEPRVGGSVAFHMGPDATSHGRVTVFEPDRRLVYEEDWATLIGRPGADVTPLVTEFLVDARSGGSCVVRVVTSAFGTGADWENEFFEEMSLGWAPILDNLRLYLTHFPGQRAASLWAQAAYPGPAEDAIAAVRQELDAAVVGDEVSRRGIRGRVERSSERQLLVRLAEPVPGFLSFFSFAEEDHGGLLVQGYLFSADAGAYVDREQAEWQAWLETIAADAAAASTRTT